jgi:hypothetical protein
MNSPATLIDRFQADLPSIEGSSDVHFAALPAYSTAGSNHSPDPKLRVIPGRRLALWVIPRRTVKSGRRLLAQSFVRALLVLLLAKLFKGLLLPL